MAIADDFSVATNGDIRHVSGSTNYTVLAMHRFLGDLADDAQASGNDLVDITTSTPSSRSTDNIITLLSTFNIDDTAAEFLYDGSVKQGTGATETIYSGLRVLGATNNSNTQLVVIQDNALYDGAAPFWGTQSGGGYNNDPAQGVIMRCLIKTREYGADIDGQRVRVQARHWGDSYSFFNVSMGEGESVAAISTTPDAQNDTTQGTVTAYTHVVNSGGTANAPTGGYQTIDLNNGNGAQPYYSKWTFGADTSGDGLKGMWEYLKDLVGNGSSKTCDGITGEFMLGITNSLPYDNESGGPFTERETVVWGTEIVYDGLTGGTFSAGDYVRISRAAVVINAGKVIYDNGTTTMIVALEDISTALADDDVITEASAGTVYADATAAIVDDDKGGGEGILLALNDEGVAGDLWVQLISGVSPVEDLEIRGITSSATCDVDAGLAAPTVPNMFQGSYTGNLIGAYGIGVDDGDLTATDSVEDLLGVTQTPPNNVTFTVSGLENGEDYVLVGPKDTGDDIEKDQRILNTTLNASGQTSIIVTVAIPSDTPATGTVRVQLDSGIYRRVAYTSWTGSTFTTASTDWTDPLDATAGNNIFISYIDVLCDAASEAFTSVFSAPRSLWIRVRDGGGTPIKTYEAPGTLASTGGSAVASRITDA